MPTISVTRLAENPHESMNGIRADTASRGVDLAGAKVTVGYADGTSEILTWQAFDPYTNGGANGAGVNMSFGFDWHHLTATKLLTSLAFDLQPASSVFDTTLTSDTDPAGGSTPGSREGFPFRVAPEHEADAGNITVTYSGIVNLAGSPPQGDLYTTMTVDFSGLPAGGIMGDFSWNSDIDTMRDAGDLVPAVAPCFTRGTLIATDRGDLPVETLRPGDRIMTQDNGFQTLILALSRMVGTAELRNNPKLFPVRIRAGALGSGLPKRDLIVSRQHRMVAKSKIVKRMFGVNNVLVAAIRLAELPGVQVMRNIDHVEYFHLIFAKHQIIFAERTPTESYLMSSETRMGLAPEAWTEFVTLFPRAVDPTYMANPIRKIPTREMQKTLVHRHVKNGRELFCA